MDHVSASPTGPSVQGGSPQSRLTREQKTGFVLLLIFGMLAVALGVLQLRNTIYSPFAPQFTVAQQDTTRLFSDEQARLQQIDTDGDGLNDYEELEFYGTSPYLPDTDSDGVGDKSEIDAGDDPNCPSGTVCHEDIQQNQYSDSLVGSPLANQTSPFGDFGVSSSTPPERSDFGIAPEELQEIVKDPARLRALLEQSGGISREELARIDDQTLLNYAAQIFPQTDQPARGTPTTTP